MPENTPIHDEELAALRKARGAMTPGEWSYVPGIAYKHYVCAGECEHDGEKYDEMRFSLQEFHPVDGHETRAAADCAGIAACVNAVPNLVGEIDRLRAEIDRLREEPAWTTDPPTEPGIYLIRIGGFCVAPTYVRPSRFDSGGLIYGLPGWGNAVTNAPEGTQWRGPLWREEP